MYLSYNLLIGGLEVKLPNSERWQKLGNLPGAIFINAGELLSTWTNNLYPALVLFELDYLSFMNVAIG